VSRITCEAILFSPGDFTAETTGIGSCCYAVLNTGVNPIDMDALRAADEGMLEDLERRCVRTDRAAVAEEVLDEHPLLAGRSFMHYVEAPRSADDFPGLLERKERWARWLEEGQREARTQRRLGFGLNHDAMLSVLAQHERLNRLQFEFMELVAKRPNTDIIGYWVRNGPAADTLMALCAHTRPQGVMLAPELLGKQPFVFLYSELENAQSRLAGVIQSILEHGFDPVFYLYNFTPALLYRVHHLHPRSRIIGITTPEPNVENQCLALLKAKLGEKKK